MKKQHKPITYVEDEKGCWLLTSHANLIGNASAVINGKQILICRYLYIQKFGEISEKAKLFRKCKNKLCVNPDHQFLKNDGIEYTIDDKGCWFSKDREGNFPHFERDGETHQINILLYEEKYGKVPEGMKLIRTCKQKGCINPDHVLPGHVGGHNKVELAWEEKWVVDYLDTPCWVCCSHKVDKDGYFRYTIGDRVMLLHRYMYEKYKEPLIPGMNINHHCDNPSCINPDHLYQGTQTDNMLDFHRRHGKNSKGKNPLPEWMVK